MPYTAAQIEAHISKLLEQEYKRERMDTDLINVLEEMQSLLLDNEDDYAELDETSIGELWDTALDACRERAYTSLRQPNLIP